MEAGQRDELEPVAQRRELALEGRDLRVAQVLAPVERRRAVVGEQLAGVAARGSRRRTAPPRPGPGSRSRTRAGRRTGRRRDRGRSRRRCRRAHGRSPRPCARRCRTRASASSMSLVRSFAESASVRATTSVGTSATSAASRAATSVRTCWLVGTSTLPPRWPHFFSDESWSSKCTAAAPASMNDFMISNALSGAAEAGLGVGDDRRQPVDRVVALGVGDLVGAQEGAVDPLHERGRAVRRVEALVGIRVAREVRVGGDLPAGEVDRLQPRLHHLHRLAAGHGAERGHPLAPPRAAAAAAPPRAARACARRGRSRAAARRRPRSRGARWCRSVLMRSSFGSSE